MFQTLSVNGFRGFTRLTVEKLDRFNLFIGRNNVGKTALLESLFLLLGPANPDLTLTITSFRGIEQFKADPEDLWGWLFHGKDMDHPITIEVQLDDGRSRRLTIAVESPEILQVEQVSRGVKKLKARPPASATTALKPGGLSLSYSDECGRQSSAKAFLKDGGGIGVHRKGSVKLPDSVFVTARGGHNPENSERFSKLEAVGDEGKLLTAMKRLEPRLKKLAVLVTTAGPIIHGEIGIGRMIPIPLMGDGFSRLLTLLLSLYASKGAVLLVDEVDNGIHFSALSTIWNILADEARENGVQIFATTHSWECLTAAKDSFEKTGKTDLLVHRLDRDLKSNSIKVTTYDTEMMSTAIESGIEVR